MARAFSGATVVAAVLASSGPAGAQIDKRVCLATYVEAQSKRQEGKLIAARAAAMTCASDPCPGVLRSDCVAWLRELDASIPTVVFSASTPDGRDVSVARVTVDGRLPAERIVGEGVPMDPGEHVASCEADGLARVDLRFVAAQGEKNRAIRFVLVPISGAAQAPRAPGYARPIPPLTYALGALGIVGLGVWAGVGASAFWGSPGVETLRRCTPNCEPSDRADVERKLNAADVAGATAVLALGGALTIYLTRPVVMIAPVRDGAIGAWVTTF